MLHNGIPIGVKFEYEGKTWTRVYNDNFHPRQQWCTTDFLGRRNTYPAPYKRELMDQAYLEQNDDS